MRQLPFGTAQAEVLLKLASRPRADWSHPDGAVLYESRAMTDAVCQSLARHGLVDERRDDGHSVYTVNKAGHRKARELRGGL